MRQRRALKAFCFSRGPILLQGDNVAAGIIVVPASERGAVSDRDVLEERFELFPECGAALDIVGAPSGLTEREFVAVSSIDDNCSRLTLPVFDLLRGVSTVANKSWWYWKRFLSLFLEEGLEDGDLLERLDAGLCISGKGLAGLGEC